MNPQYVVYITFYRGNLLPPFYIGYTTESKVLKGYNGTVASKKYKTLWQQERRDNPHLFKTVILQRFETDSEAIAREEFLHRFFDVPNNSMFINMSISRGKFGASGLNNPNFGKKCPPRPDIIERNKKGHTVESRLKMSVSRKGKKRFFTIEHRINLGLGMKGNKNKKGKITSEETKRKLRGRKSLVVCPVCGKCGGSNVMKRWHFDNCKDAYIYSNPDRASGRAAPDFL